MRSLDGSNEKLRPICVRPGISHTQKSRFVMFVCKVFVFKFFSINTFTSCAISGKNRYRFLTCTYWAFEDRNNLALPVGKITSLDHELLNHTVKYATFIVQRFSRRLAFAFFSSTKSTKVFSGFRYNIVEQLDDNSKRGKNLFYMSILKLLTESYLPRYSPSWSMSKNTNFLSLDWSDDEFCSPATMLTKYWRKSAKIYDIWYGIMSKRFLLE